MTDLGLSGDWPRLVSATRYERPVEAARAVVAVYDKDYGGGDGPAVRGSTDEECGAMKQLREALDDA